MYRERIETNPIAKHAKKTIGTQADEGLGFGFGGGTYRFLLDLDFGIFHLELKTGTGPGHFTPMSLVALATAVH